MPILSEKFLSEIEIFIPKPFKTGRSRSCWKIALRAIFWLMYTGAQWHSLPAEFGAPTTIHDWFLRLIRAGVFEMIFEHMRAYAINELGAPEAFILDTVFAKAQFAIFGERNLTDRGKRGVKAATIIDWNRIVISAGIAPANVHDSKLLTCHLSTLEKFVHDKPLVLATDSAWDSEKLRKLSADKDIVLLPAHNNRRNKDKRKYSPIGRWKIEQHFGQRNWYRGLKICTSKLKETALAFLQLFAAIHNFKLVGVSG